MGAANMITIQCIYVVFLVGVVGNALVIFIILLYVKMNIATNIYLLNLAITDELFMLSLPFMACWLPCATGLLGRLRGVLSIDALNMFISVFCLKCLDKTYTAHSHIPAIQPAQRNLALAWYLHWSHSAWWVVFVVYTFLLGLLLLGLAISLCYLLIMYKMMAVALRAAWQQQRCSEKNTWLVLMLAAVFVLCWRSFHVG
ncbi:somatostatin receptor 4 [Phyllostomus discolor]|uniref:Somatostatin receptor 4 n=1 Tax=Phyllostomus discolor TaxID=89673 RepID=A0A834DQC8_9CHIR|nr:somatostatin receptor 4 [Phyllostomus discolor]